jgi:predicted amidohydrolase
MRGYFIILFLTGVIAMASAQPMNFEKYRGYPEKKIELRMASVAVFPTKWDKPANWQKIEKMVREAAVSGGADLIVTPEGVLEGYVINEVNEAEDSSRHAALVAQFFDLAEPIDGIYIQQACQLCRELGVFLVLGFLEKADRLVYNTAILIDSAGEIVGRYRKTHFAQGYEINPPFYQPGNDYPVWDTPFGKIGIIICYDRQLPEPARIMAVKGAQFLIVPAFGSWSDENGWNTILMRARAYENRMALLFCNPNQSLIIDDHGDLKQIGGKDEIVYHTFELKSERDQNHLANRRPETYSEITQSQ